jgi:hypothetical protein
MATMVPAAATKATLNNTISPRFAVRIIDFLP